jgi:hypothetical protein
MDVFGVDELRRRPPPDTVATLDVEGRRSAVGPGWVAFVAAGAPIGSRTSNRT